MLGFSFIFFFSVPKNDFRNKKRNLAQSSRTNSYSSTASSFRDNSFCSGEPITLFRLELERLQYILHFPEEVAFQVKFIDFIFCKIF